MKNHKNDKITTIKELITNISRQLDICSETPDLDAEILIGYVLKKSRAELFAHPEIQVTSVKKNNCRIM